MIRRLPTVLLVSQLQEELGRVLEQLRGLAEDVADSAVGTPPLDVVETDDAHLVLVEVPGVPAARLSVRCEGRSLTITGRRDGETRGGRFRCLERSRGEFERHLRLPEGLDPDSVEARLENGVLTVRLPKRPDRPGPREIPIDWSEEPES